MKRNLKAQLLTVAIVTALAGPVFAQSGSRKSTGSTPEQVGATSGTSGQSSSTRGTGSTATSSTTAGTSGGGAAAMMGHDGIVRQGGHTYFVKDGKAHKVDHEMKLSEGITAEKNGKVTMKDGTKVNLEDGKMVTLDGKVMDTPPEVSSAVGAGSSKTGGGSTQLPSTQ